MYEYVDLHNLTGKKKKKKNGIQIQPITQQVGRLHTQKNKIIRCTTVKNRRLSRKENQDMTRS